MNGNGQHGNSQDGSADILNGWKEIAAYMGRGVRTVQRWETIGLPVRRPCAQARSACLAFKTEIDRWLKQGRPSRETHLTTIGDRYRQAHVAEALQRHTQQLGRKLQESRTLRGQMRLLVSELRLTMKQVRCRVKSRETAKAAAAQTQSN